MANYVSLHLRVPARIAHQLRIIADHDTRTKERSVTLNELHRSAAVAYVRERGASDPDLAEALRNITAGSSSPSTPDPDPK